VVTKGSLGGTPQAEHRGDARDTALTSWSGHLRAVDRALGRRDADGARQAWERAHLAAVESLSWEGLIEAGRACLRIGSAIGSQPAAEPEARREFFAALYRACRENSLEGILRAAKAFHELGDREVVEECLGLAELRVDGEQTRRSVAALVGCLGLAPARLGADGAADAIGMAWTDAVDPEGGTRHDR
jgi:hypothetical protein